MLTTLFEIRTNAHTPRHLVTYPPDTNYLANVGVPHSTAWMMRVSELTTEIRKKIDAHCQRQKCSPGGSIRFMQIFLGFRNEEVSNDSGVVRTGDFFFVISVAISLERLKMKPILRCGVMKCFIGFPLTLEYLTLNDAILCRNLFLSSVWRNFSASSASGDNCVKTNEDTSILSTTEMLARNSILWLCKAYADIRYGSRARRLQLTVSERKRPIFNACSRHIFRTFKN